MTEDDLACPRCSARTSATQNYCGNCGIDLRSASTHGALQITSAAERRHLTVVFCDLVGSTALSEQLDPEELGEVILAYREVAATAITRYGGYVARYVGDGILAYFGYPRAHGDDPLRAVHASLQILAGMRTLAQTLGRAKGIEISARIGVHSGLVVVGELVRGEVREQAGVVGETPNLASRLIELAMPNTALVSDVTHSMIKRHFECREYPATLFKGLSRSIAYFEVIGARTQESCVGFAWSASGIVDRETEFAFLQACWGQVVQGTGQVVSIVGEPGIGKSRLVREFAESLVGAHHLKIELYCSPYFSNTAFHPIIYYLNRQLAKSDADKIEQLAEAIQAAGMSPMELVPIICALLSLPLRPPYQAPMTSARIQRERTMAFLHNWLARQAVERPILLLVEDLHWSDASSQEFVVSLINRIQSATILLLLTARPDFHWRSSVPAHVSRLQLDRLTTLHVHEMIENVASGKRLSVFIRDELAAKSDGVPLFIEELTKAVVESERFTENESSNESLNSSIGFEIPISLQATLMARLDNLNSTKLIAQRAAVIGREFSYDLVARIIGMPAGELDYALARLIETGLLFQRDPPPRASYIFKHSLIQEAAYHSLLRVKRKEYHRQIAEILVSDFQHLASTQPELVAHHYSGAEIGIAAASYWRRAAELAMARSAIVEAVGHINKGLAELATVPKSSLRAQEEVMLLIALGTAWTALKGYAAPEVEQTYARARQLCAELNTPDHLFPVLRGLQSFYIVRGPLRIAHDMAEQLREMAEAAGNAVQRVEAHRRLGWCLFCLGKIDAGRGYLQRAMQEYDRTRSAQHIVMYGSDPAVIGLVNLAWLEWFAGRTGTAKRYSNQSVALARELSFPLALSYALGMSAALYQCLRDPETAAKLAEETIELAQNYGFPYWTAWETSIVGWARATLGDVEDGVKALEGGLAAYRETGAELFCPHMLGLLAEVNVRAHRFDKALACCEEALASSERSDVHFFDAEIHRLAGECILSRDGDATSAETSFSESIALAREQGAAMLELRCAISLAKLKSSQGRIEIASSLLLKAIVGVDTDEEVPELKEAYRLLRDWDRT